MKRLNLLRCAFIAVWGTGAFETHAWTYVGARCLADITNVSYGGILTRQALLSMYRPPTIRAEASLTSRKDPAAAGCSASWKLLFLLHTGKVSSATVTRGPPLRLLTRTTNYMIFPGQPPPTAGVNCSTLLTSSRQTSRCPSPIRVRPSREPVPLWIPYPGTRGGEGEGGRMVYTFDSFFR